MLRFVLSQGHTADLSSWPVPCPQAKGGWGFSGWTFVPLLITYVPFPRMELYDWQEHWACWAGSRSHSAAWRLCLQGLVRTQEPTVLPAKCSHPPPSNLPSQLYMDLCPCQKSILLTGSVRSLEEACLAPSPRRGRGTRGEGLGVRPMCLRGIRAPLPAPA